MTDKKYYAMDFAFFSSLGTYSFADRCEITKAAGYDGLQAVLWDGRDWEQTLQLRQTRDRYGLDIFGVYTVLDLSLDAADVRNSDLVKIIEGLPHGAVLELAVKSAGPGIGPSNPNGDARVVAWLRDALAVAQPRDIHIALYTHIKFWLETHDDALRLCEAIDHPNLGITFSSLQWYAGGGRDVGGLLRSAIHRVKRANLSGSRKSPLGFFQVATIEPLDTGELDNFAILSQLRRLGYQGPVGYNGWHEGGDPFVKLQRSLDVLRDMDRRIEQHPHWGAHLDA